jgi:hypothetical protein
LATGNGRCNFTNVNLAVENYHGQNPAFSQGALRRFSPRQTLDFFANLGVVPKVEDDGRVFPASNQAASVLDLLRWELEALGVEVRLETPVYDINLPPFTVRLPEDSLQAEKVILATGGKAYPQSGSDGSGLELAQKLGHSIIKPRPALVQLQLGGVHPQLAGIKIQAQVQLLTGGAPTEREGELLFTNYGLSGLPALALSRQAGEMLSQGKRPHVAINLVPGFSQGELERALASRLCKQPGRPLGRLLAGWLPTKLGETLISAAKLSPVSPSGALTAAQLHKLSGLMLGWRFPVTGLLGWQHAQVTAGGVDVSQVNPGTMESRLVKGLYFTGEILDLDGDSGGYNLQWAWSSGYLAGLKAAQSLGH